MGGGERGVEKKEQKKRRAQGGAPTLKRYRGVEKHQPSDSFIKPVTTCPWIHATATKSFKSTQ